MKYLIFYYTKLIVSVYGAGSNIPHSLYTDAHPLSKIKMKLEKV